MELNETASYIAGRLRIAGGRPEQVFTREAVSAVFQASGGLPRTVNVICDNAMIGGFAAQVKPLNAAFVEEVCRDFDINRVLGSVPPASSLSDQGAAAVPAPEGPEPVSAPEVPSPSSGEAPEVESSVTPMFGTVNRKRRFSFF
jgi:hypothetical protein